jgi:hypothetical protein
VAVRCLTNASTDVSLQLKGGEVVRVGPNSLLLSVRPGDRDVHHREAGVLC